MATAGTIVTRALRLIGVIDPFETPADAEMSTGIDALNDMLHAWTTEGLLPSFATVTQGDSVSVDDRMIRGIRYALAAELAAEFAVPIPTEVAVITLHEMTKILNNNTNVEAARFEMGLTHLPLNRRPYRYQP